MSVGERFLDHLSAFKTVPFLFIGSGLSRRYLGVENWEDLLRKYSAVAGRQYEYYRSTANGDLPGIATAIAADLHDRWWTEDRFTDSRTQNAADAVRKDSALKIEISRYLRSLSVNVASEAALQAEVDLLRRAVVDGVITTNWDLFLEDVFPGYERFIGQDELIFQTAQSIGEIYKIHGCSTKPNSLVLTSDDYARFNERNPYLAAKLLTVFVEHPVIFLGYSLNDANITGIIRSVAACLTTETLPHLRDRLIFIQWDASAIEGEIGNGSIVASGYSIPVVTVKLASFLPIFEALASLRRRFPARLLRRLKQHVYELVLSGDPHEQLFVKDLEDDSDPSKIDVVFGVGAISTLKEKGYRGLSRDDLVRDVILDDQSYNALAVVRQTLPSIFRSGTRYVPVFKYLRSGLAVEPSLLAELGQRVAAAARRDQSSFSPPLQYRKKGAALASEVASLAELLGHCSRFDVLMYAPLLPKDKLDKDVLKAFLVENIDLLQSSSSIHQTQFIKLVCLYDWLAYSAGEGEQLPQAG